MALLLRGDVTWSQLADAVTPAASLTPAAFCEANRPIAEALASGVEDLTTLVDYLDDESSRRASYYALAPVRFSDTDKAIKDALARLVPQAEVEQELKALTTQLEQAAAEGEWERWNRLMERKIALKAKALTAKGDE